MEGSSQILPYPSSGPASGWVHLVAIIFLGMLASVGILCRHKEAGESVINGDIEPNGLDN